MLIYISTIILCISINLTGSNANEPEFHTLDGDILIDKAPDKFVEDKLKQDEALIKKRRSKRNAIRDLRFRWPGGRIPYKFDLPRRDWEFKVRKAMDFLEEETCVKFVNWTGIERQYVRITAYTVGQPGCMLHGTGPGTPFPPQYRGGCWSAVGRQYDYVGQVVCYGEDANCLVSCQQEIIHELLHVTGLYHEHSRFDRDDYLYIHQNNIQPNVYKDAFKKYTRQDVDHYGEVYDYTSVLHYQWNAFAINKDRATMTAKKNWAPKLVHPCYQTHSASPSDVRKVNKMYQCHASNRLTQINQMPRRMQTSLPRKLTSQNLWPQTQDDSISNSQNQLRRCTIVHGIIIPGNYMRKYLDITSHGECCELCGNIPKCVAWNWLAGTSSCYLKSALGGTSSPLKGATFGQVVGRIKSSQLNGARLSKGYSFGDGWGLDRSPSSMFRRYLSSWRIQQNNPLEREH